MPGRRFTGKPNRGAASAEGGRSGSSRGGSSRGSSKPGGAKPGGGKSRSKSGGPHKLAPRKKVKGRPIRFRRTPHPEGERLQKVLAAAGLGSRRKCEELILEGRVEVDQQIATELGARVNPETQTIRVDGVDLPQPKRVYFVLHKPTGVLSTSHDPSGRTRVIDLLPPNVGRIFSVGRLDQSSEGLILLTNDGDLANQLTHPRYGVPKTYLVEVVGQPTDEALREIRGGVRLAEGWVHARTVYVKSSKRNSTVLEMVLDEGRNREIRRMLAKTGNKVQRLVRVAVGPVRLGDLPAGAYRELQPQEVKELRDAIGKPGATKREAPAPSEDNLPRARKPNKARVAGQRAKERKERLGQGRAVANEHRTMDDFDDLDVDQLNSGMMAGDVLVGHDDDDSFAEAPAPRRGGKPGHAGRGRVVGEADAGPRGKGRPNRAPSAGPSGFGMDERRKKRGRGAARHDEAIILDNNETQKPASNEARPAGRKPMNRSKKGTRGSSRFAEQPGKRHAQGKPGGKRGRGKR